MFQFIEYNAFVCGGVLTSVEVYWGLITIITNTNFFHQFLAITEYFFANVVVCVGLGYSVVGLLGFVFCFNYVVCLAW